MKICQLQKVAFRLDDLCQVEPVYEPDSDSHNEGKKNSHHFSIDLAAPHKDNWEWTFYFGSARSANYYRNKLIADWAILED